jgi:dolichol-phosphate mannosyltransferase
VTLEPIDLSIVLPAYQEADNLRRLLPVLHEVARSLTSRYEIVVVDTEQALDDTPTVCRENGVVYAPRRGGSLYGHAIRTALEVARGRHVAFLDADGSHNPRFLPQLWAERDGADLVIASRYIRGGKTENPAVLILMSLIVNVVFRIVLGLKCYDVSNSFRLYQGDALRQLRLECDNFDIIEEILIKLSASHPGFRIKEVPFTFEKRKAGTTKRRLLSFALGYVATLARLWRFKRQARKQLGSKT